MSSLMYKNRPYGGTSTVNDASHITVDTGGGSSATAQQLFEFLLTIVQESAFEIVLEDGEYVLYWHGASGECPYSIVLEDGAYVLYFNYNIT